MTEKTKIIFIVQNMMTRTNNHDQNCILFLKNYSSSKTYTLLSSIWKQSFLQIAPVPHRLAVSP